jgi:hypothetical protein
MKSVKVLSVFLFVSFLVFSCGDSGSNKKDENPTGGGANAGSLSNHEGTNANVTTDNVETVSSEINTTAWEVFGRALQTVTSKVANPTADYTQQLKGDVNGNNSGKATVNGKYVVKMSGTTPTSYNYSFTCTYYDFSDDGLLWLGGTMTFSGAYNLTNYTYNITVKGNISFNGSYEGVEVFTAVFDIDINQATQTYTVTTKVTSGGETFESTFTY